MTREQLPVCEHKATWNTGCRSYSLWNNLRNKNIQNGKFWLILTGWTKKTSKKSTKMQMHVWNWWGGTTTHCHEANLKAFQMQMHEWKEVWNCAFSHTSHLISRMHKLRTSGKMHSEKKVSVWCWLTPLETDWQRSCIQSAISSSFSALSSNGGCSVRITWNAWGFSVLFERLQPPQCPPLQQKHNHT